MGSENTNRSEQCISGFGIRVISEELESGQRCVFLDCIITTDETWLHYYEPETKQQSSVWKNVDSPPPKQAMWKEMCIMN